MKVGHRFNCVVSQGGKIVFEGDVVAFSKHAGIAYEAVRKKLEEFCQHRLEPGETATTTITHISEVSKPALLNFSNN